MGTSARVQSRSVGAVPIDDSIRCSECHREVDEFTAIKESWGYWSDGCGDLLPFCPKCAQREFADDGGDGSSLPAREPVQ